MPTLNRSSPRPKPRQQASWTLPYLTLLKTEADHRQENELRKRLKTARLPRSHDLNAYDHTVDNGLPRTRLIQLRELNWIDQVYNIMLMGPSGTGKTLLASGLCADAVEKGYKAYFRTMDELLHMLKLKDVTRSAINSSEFIKYCRDCFFHSPWNEVCFREYSPLEVPASASYACSTSKS